MTATITIPHGFIAGEVPEAVRKLIPKGIDGFLFVPLAGEATQQKIVCLAMAKDGKTAHVSIAAPDAELADAPIFYERFILPASDALRRRFERVKT